MSDSSTRRRTSADSVPPAVFPVCSGRLPAMADFFSPRPETGHGLAVALARAGSGPGPRQPAVTVLTGPAGYGKSALAASLVSGFARSGEVDVQVWVDASSQAAIVVGYARAAADVGLTERGVLPETAARRFLDWLARTDRTWLVVLDDLSDPGVLRGLWPSGSRGQVLITCQDPEQVSLLDELRPRVCPISEFSPREALGYLTSRLYDDADKRAEAVDLAADLRYMPLALALATATMAGTTLSCRDYRLRFAARWPELAGRTADAMVTPAEVAWSLALDRADQRPPAGLARPLLALAAMAGRGTIPVRLLTSPAASGYLSGRGAGAPADPGQVLAALGSLAQVGLVTVLPAGPETSPRSGPGQAAAEPGGASPGNQGTAEPAAVLAGLVMLHPVVQEAARRLMPIAELDAAARAAAEAIGQVWPQCGGELAVAQALRDCAAWLGTAVSALTWTPEPHPGLLSVGTGLAEAGLAGTAIGYWTSMLGVSIQVLGADHAQTLALRDLAVGACEAAGRLDEAMEAAGASVAERERAQGPDHPDTLTARIVLARMHRAKGMYDVAIDLYERALADREWVLGAGHPDTLMARSQLSGTYLLAGRGDQAIIMYQRNLTEWERAFGPEHREVLIEYSNLGRAYQSAGRFDDAIAVFRSVCAARERSLGQGHPDLFASQGDLAFAYRTAGRIKDAVPLYRQALAGRESVLGPDHPDTLTALANLASCYHSAGRMKDAIPLYERALAVREAVQGPDHRDTLTARGNLAGAYHSAGRLAEALALYERTLADFERTLGQDHPDTLTSRANLAHAYHMARRHSDAISTYERALADSERALGADHPLTRTICDNLKFAAR